MEIAYRQLNDKNFTNHSLDGFIRHQRVSECWRNVEGAWQLVPISFEENWPLEQCREIAADVAVHMEKDQTAFGAFDGERLVGFVTVSHNFFGETAKYLELVCFQVSEPYRGKGIGTILFNQACQEAKRLGAEDIRRKKVRQPIKLWAVFMPGRSIGNWQRKNLLMCNWNIR